MFFSLPLLSYTIQGSKAKGDFKDKIRYHEVSNRNIDLLASFCSRFKILLEQKKWNAFEHPKIRASILGCDWGMIGCCKLLNQAFDTYRDGLPHSVWMFHFRPDYQVLPHLEYVVASVSLNILYSNLNLLVCLFSASRLEETRRALLYFLFARYVGIDRYCKYVSWTAQPKPILLSSTLINNVRSLVGRTKETTLPFFDNIPYLRRFRLRDGSFFISSSVDQSNYTFCILLTRWITLRRVHLPEPPNLLIEDAAKKFLRDFSVDTLLLGVDMVLWLRIDKFWPPFVGTGHYPILAGTNQHGEELYVAAAKVDDIYYFTCVEDGAKSARYTDEIGDVQETEEFFVLALRYDPSDATPPYPPTHAGAMDPTGPLHWLKFWPEKDPDYVALSDSAREDDDHLEALLNSFHGNTKKDVDIWWWG